MAFLVWRIDQVQLIRSSVSAANRVALKTETEHETESQQWTESQIDEDSDSEEILSRIPESCATDLTHHPQLETDIEAVRTLYSDSAASIREYGSIDDVDVDLNINANVLEEEVAMAWSINPSEPIVIRLNFSPSQYLDGPAPSVKVFQPSNTDNFSLTKQLQNVLTVFLSHEWKHLTNDNVVVRQKRRHSWFRPRGTVKKCRARLSIWLPPSKSSVREEPTLKARIISPAMNRFTNHTTSYAIKNPTGELFTDTPSGKRVAVSAVKSSAQLSTKQLMELLFSSQAIRHCKTTPTLQHGFLVQIMRYAEQRLPTLNEYCVVCDERHVFQNGPMLKPAVCTRELCVFSFYTLGVMSGATEEVATGAEVFDLLVAMCRAALQSSRKSIILEPFPSVVEPCNPKTLAFSPKRKSYDRLQKALDSVLLIRRMSQGPYSEIKKQMDKMDPLAHPLLQWILASNRSHIVKLPLNGQLKFMHTPHQFLLISSPPPKEAHFQTAKKLYGSTFAFHGSHIENWHSILRNGLINASYTKLQLHGAAYGKGIYLSPISSISFGYSEMGKGKHQMPTKEELIKKHNQINKIKPEQHGQARFLQNRNLNCIALCEVVTSKDLQKHRNIWVCPISDHVCTRFLFVYENGQVGDVHIDTQEARIHREILQVMASNRAEKTKNDL
ncbi:protein mono-ADP-ribosyltransferase PARP6-like [Lycodopsis pacificus]